MYKKVKLLLACVLKFTSLAAIVYVFLDLKQTRYLHFCNT